MGFWSNTFGGGNSFSQSVSNVTGRSSSSGSSGGRRDDNDAASIRQAYDAAAGNYGNSTASSSSDRNRQNEAGQQANASAQESIRQAAAQDASRAAAAAKAAKDAAERKKQEEAAAAARAREQAALVAREAARKALEEKELARVTEQRRVAAEKKAAAEAAERTRRLREIADSSRDQNSFYQQTMNKLTPNDGKEYIGGQLVGTGPISPDRALYSDNTDPVDTSFGARGIGNAPGILGIGQKALAFLSGARAGDRAVGSVDGQIIYERTDGTTYSVNQLGLPYDTVSATSTEAATRTSDPSDNMNVRSGSDEPTAEVVEGVVEEINPCPEGYMMDEETKVCVIDPFQTPFPVIQPQQPAAPQALSQYSSVSPIGLPTLNPVQQSPFVVPTPTVQPITVAQQGLASLPFRSS
jgi:hypothetical protein